VNSKITILSFFWKQENKKKRWEHIDGD
jgi:hypothetical protein